MGETILPFLISIVPRLPMLILCLIGVALAVGHTSTLRGVAICAGAGFGCLAVASLIGIASQYWMMNAMRDLPTSSIATTLGVVGTVSGAASVGGMALLMVAIFMRRTPPTA